MEEHIRHSNLIESVDDPEEDKISLAAWKWLREQKDIGMKELLELHRQITQRQLPPSQSGKLRKVMVMVGGYTPPAPMIAEMQMKEWLGILHSSWKSVDPRDMHVSFERVHPFIDGNGRTGRMLMWWHEAKLGDLPTLIKSDEADRRNYYQWFAEDN